MNRVPPRMLMVPGMLLASGGMVILTRMTVHSSYAGDILPALLLMGLGMGLTFMPVFSTATAGVAPKDAGVTSATVNTSQQVGGSIGTALLNTIATTSSAAYLAAHVTGPARRAQVAAEGTVHGYTVAIWWAAGIMLLAGLVAGLMVTTGPPRRAPPRRPYRSRWADRRVHCRRRPSPAVRQWRPATRSAIRASRDDPAAWVRVSRRSAARYVAYMPCTPSQRSGSGSHRRTR